MANLTESSVFESGVYQLETDDPVLGGAPAFDAGSPITGHANAQAQQLANRTKWLKERTIDVNGMLAVMAGNLDGLIEGPITRDANGAATSANVIWPDGATGVYTATQVSVDFPGAVDAYTLTYTNGAVSKVVTQPTVTRNSEGAVINKPAITVV